MIPQEPAPPEGARPVRRGWIICFGVLELLIGAVLGLLAVGMMALALFSDGIFKTPMAARGGLALVFPILLYGAAALLFLFAGAGTLGRRRWARILMLVVSSFWLVFGVLGGIMVLVMLPFMLEQTSKGGQAVPPGIESLVWTLVVGATLIFSVLLPGSFLLFYSRAGVKAAFEQRSPDAALRPKVPLPVAIFAIWSGIGALGTACTAPYGVLVLFGLVLTGAAAVTLTLVSAAVQGYLSWRVTRREAWVWWTAFLYHLVLGTSGAVSFLLVPMEELLALRSGQRLDPAQRSMLPVLQSCLPWIIIIGQVLFLGLILYIKRYFRARSATVELPSSA